MPLTHHHFLHVPRCDSQAPPSRLAWSTSTTTCTPPMSKKSIWTSIYMRSPSPPSLLTPRPHTSSLFSSPYWPTRPSPLSAYHHSRPALTNCLPSALSPCPFIHFLTWRMRHAQTAPYVHPSLSLAMARSLIASCAAI